MTIAVLRDADRSAYDKSAYAERTTIFLYEVGELPLGLRPSFSYIRRRRRG